MIPPRGVRWMLLVLGCLAAIALFLLATATANTDLFAGNYDALVILNGVMVALFAIQKRGTATIGAGFGPVMCLWFVTIGVLGALEVVSRPAVLAALNPAYGVTFIVDSPFFAFLAFGAVVLAVTGTEALYADMHRTPAWCCGACARYRTSSTSSRWRE